MQQATLPSFDNFQFQGRRAQPVEAHVTADGIASNGLSFSDYARGHCFDRELFRGRDSTPPVWAIDLRKLGLLLARYFECRAGIHFPKIDTPERRVVAAQQKILSALPSKIAILDRLMAEYVALKAASGDPERLRMLERQVRTLDGALVVEQRGPALILGVVWYFFRCGFSSAETSAALNGVVSPVAVRQIASRLTALWERMASGKDHPPTKDEFRKAKRRAWWVMSGRDKKQLEKEKARRAAETPAQRVARLTYAKRYYYGNRDRIRAQQKADWKKRDRAMLARRSATPEQIEIRKQKARVYVAKNREKLNADQRRRYALRAAALTPEEKAILHAQQREYRQTHRAQRRATEARMREKKQAQRRIAKEQSRNIVWAQ